MKQLWQDTRFQDISGHALRPGGLALTEYALRYCQKANLLPKQGYAADMGTGQGASLALIHTIGLTAIGLDLSRTFAHQSRSLPSQGLRLIADVCKPPLAQGRFCLILFECVLSLLEDPGQALFWAHELLTPQGICVISDLVGSPQAHASCLGGARKRCDWQDLFQSHKLCVLHYEDISKAVRELAAKLCWYGADLAQGACLPAVGYGLWICGRNNQLQTQGSA